MPGQFNGGSATMLISTVLQAVIISDLR